VNKISILALMPDRITKNKKVSIVYSIMNDKGEVIMEVSPYAPVFYLHGYQNENIVPGLENALEGHKEGDVFSVELPHQLAFGAYNKQLVMEVAKEELTPFIDDFWVGGYIESFDEETGDEMSDSERFFMDIEKPQEPNGFIIREIRKDTIVLDGNHPCAGMDLIFNVRVVSVENASIMELENGYPKESENYDDEY
jgi:FKBP-type peptidyl-prolyl cis-trans isomerase SlyD